MVDGFCAPHFLFYNLKINQFELVFGDFLGIWCLEFGINSSLQLELIITIRLLIASNHLGNFP